MDFAYCGLDCSECPVYLATIRKNTDEQIKLANEYSTDVTKFSKEDMPLLSDSEQTLIQAIFFEELSEREVGLKLGVTQSVVNKRKAKILAKLRKIMENKI